MTADAHVPIIGACMPNSIDYTGTAPSRSRNRPVPASGPIGVARALRLTEPEHDHLFRLAGLQPPNTERICDTNPPGVERLLTRLGETPAAAFTADWRLVWWNDCWATLVGDPSVLSEEQPGRPAAGGTLAQNNRGKRMLRGTVESRRRRRARRGP